MGMLSTSHKLGRKMTGSARGIVTLASFVIIGWSILAILGAVELITFTVEWVGLQR
jgi:hypothetical protein